MKLKKLKKIKQEQQGWPDTIKIPSTYQYDTFFFEGARPGMKNVCPAMYISTGHCQTWRPL